MEPFKFKLNNNYMKAEISAAVKQSIIKQFSIIETSIHRARLPFDTDMMDKRIIEVSLWELMKSYKQIENLIREIDPVRFGIKTVEVYKMPEINKDELNLCPICGDDDCTSDHK